MNELFQKLKQIVSDAEADLTKALSGNQAAGVRVRKVMQEVKKTAQDIRKASMTESK